MNVTSSITHSYGRGTLVCFYSLNSDQRDAYDEILRHVDNDIPGVFFIDGPRGTRKKFLYKAFLAKVRSRGLIALATASSGVAANNMPGGRTSHSRFKIPINLENNSLYNIKKQSGTAKRLRAAKLIIWDEASMADRQDVEALDRSMKDITGMRLPCCGKIMVLGGDFRQVLLVVRHGTRAQVVDSSLRMSLLWFVMKKIRLTLNMRARTDPWFFDFFYELEMEMNNRKFEPKLIDAEIAIGQHAGKRVFLPRIPLSLSEADMFPFKLKRKQFPVRVPRVFVTCRNMDDWTENCILLHFMLGQQLELTGIWVFSLDLDGRPIRGNDVLLLIESDVFKRLDDNDAVSLCCVGILQLVLLGVEDRRHVHNWILRLANDRVRWDNYPWGSYTCILESFRTATDDYYTRYCRHSRIVAWSSKHKFYRNMLKPMLHMLVPDETEARSRWGYQQMKEKNVDMYEKLTRFMEDMRRVPEAHTTPIIADQHFGVSDMSEFQSYQGAPSAFNTLANNSSYFNMPTPSNYYPYIN
nr:hypothetical protein [Tanacetum cinerariifolium]